MIFLSFVLSPGVLIVFVFLNDIFLSLDIFKLVLLSFSAVLPICAINFIFTLFAFRYKDFIKDTSESQTNFTLLAIVLSSIPLYLVLFTRFLFRITLVHAIWECILIEIFYFIISLITFKVNKDLF